MTVGELKQIIQDLPSGMEVYTMSYTQDEAGEKDSYEREPVTLAHTGFQDEDGAFLSIEFKRAEAPFGDHD